MFRILRRFLSETNITVAPSFPLPSREHDTCSVCTIFLRHTLPAWQHTRFINPLKPAISVVFLVASLHRGISRRLSVNHFPRERLRLSTASTRVATPKMFPEISPQISSVNPHPAQIHLHACVRIKILHVERIVRLLAVF